jgi:hypothetical protein
LAAAGLTALLQSRVGGVPRAVVISSESALRWEPPRKT